MAITFSKSISTTEFLNAFNNNVVEFSSDDVLDSVKCVVNINSIDFEITPDTSNVFRFNFKEAVSTFVKQNRFADDIIPDEDIEADTTLKYSYEVTYTITFSDDSEENTNQTYVFLRSVEQIANVSSRLLTEQQVLTPTDLTFFNGYPFDVAHYSDGNLTAINTGTGFSIELTSATGTTDRIFFSRGGVVIGEASSFKTRVEADGGTYETNSCFTAIATGLINIGYNNITLIDSTTITLDILLKDICDGVYLKWANKKGGFSYWLFNPIYKDKLTIKTIDVFNTDFDSIDETYTTELVTKRQPTFTKDLVYNNLTASQMSQIEDILDSPRIEMYNGDKGDSQSVSSWQTVTVKSASQIIKNTKHSLINFKLKIKVNKYSI